MMKISNSFFVEKKSEHKGNTELYYSHYNYLWLTIAIVNRSTKMVIVNWLAVVNAEFIFPPLNVFH